TPEGQGDARDTQDRECRVREAHDRGLQQDVTRYRREEARPRRRRQGIPEEEQAHIARAKHRDPEVMSRSIDELLDAARARLHRLSPEECADAVTRGALLVDTRPLAQRRADGEIPGALVIERNVLEWRLDPNSVTRIPEADGYDREVIIVCNEGYSSSLAAATLHDLGLHRATDVVGGFQAWRAAGLPVQPLASE